MIFTRTTLPLIAIAVAFSVVSTHTEAATVTLTPSDSRIVSDDTTVGALGTVDPATLTGEYFIRNRDAASENEKHVASFIKFDLSSLTPSQVNAVGFSASFIIDYVSRLNTLNGLNVGLGQNISGDWDSSGSGNPLHDWGFNDESAKITADEIAIVVGIIATAPKVADITIDVQDWVNGVDSNWGFVLYGRLAASNGAGFSNAELSLNIANTVPTPAALPAGLAMFGLIGLRRTRRL